MPNDEWSLGNTAYYLGIRHIGGTATFSHSCFIIRHSLDIRHSTFLMALRTLPIIEHWDCHNCGICCYGNIIRLDEDDLARLKAQHWEEDPDFRGKRTIARHGLLKKSYTLVQRPDGGCIFLTAQGRCRIHEVHGYDAKPRICKTFPLQIVPVENGAILTTRRSCPSAAAEQGPAGCRTSGERRATRRAGSRTGRRCTASADHDAAWPEIGATRGR